MQYHLAVAGVLVYSILWLGAGEEACGAPGDEDLMSFLQVGVVPGGSSPVGNSPVASVVRAIPAVVPPLGTVAKFASGAPARSDGLEHELLPDGPQQLLACEGCQFNATRKPVVFLHIHKAGGTSMCNLANLNRERAENLPTCNWFPVDDKFPPGDPVFEAALLKTGDPPFPDCAQRWNHVRTNSLTWSQIERELRDDDYCPGMFMYATTLRDPISRMESFINFRDETFHHGNRTQSWAIEKECLRDTESCQRVEGLPTTLTFWVHLDNFMVRTLGGPTVMQLPFGGVNATHAEQALRTLNKFDAVLRLEDFDTPAAHNVLAQTFGWTVFETAHVWKSEHTVQFSDEERAQLSERNRHDYTLYQSVVSLS